MCYYEFYETVMKEQEMKTLESMKSVSEYAKLVGKPERTIRNQCKTGKLFADKVGNQWVVFGEYLEGEKKW